MCGIACIISGDLTLISEEVIDKMTNVLAHRDPEEMVWMSSKGNAGFGHRRLSIINLDVTGKQPMHYLGRYTIVYNGEIYNYVELKQDLQKQGYCFKSSSDTEVILAIYDLHKEKCVDFLMACLRLQYGMKENKLYSRPVTALVKSHFFILIMKVITPLFFPLK